MRNRFCIGFPFTFSDDFTENRALAPKKRREKEEQEGVKKEDKKKGEGENSRAVFLMLGQLDAPWIDQLNALF